jgi:hypothetical protein
MQYLQELYLNLSPWLQNLLLVIAAIAGGLLLKSLMFSMLRFTFRNHKDAVIIQSLLTRCSDVLNFLFPLFILTLSQPFFAINPQGAAYLQKTLEVLLIIGFAWLAIKLIYVIQDYININFDIEQENNFLARKIRTQVDFVKKL